jgi:hypothetical protein
MMRLRRTIVTREGGDTTHCHDIFRYCGSKALISEGRFRRTIGRRYAFGVSWYIANA